tara:strand:- start:66 stop:191 length:126 start_codon:yes stop_codon:yes gene_type:complete
MRRKEKREVKRSEVRILFIYSKERKKRMGDIKYVYKIWGVR